ncbi:MAG: ATP-grasp domain-containing protein [Phycisphaerae bacterium]|nr:ATP-grasp domain-containing protein [Phycisphaerae bacterium]
MTSQKANSNAMTIVVTCAGRRVELLQAFRRAARRLGIALRIVALDSVATAPALFVADEPVLVPAVDHPTYIPVLRELVRHHKAQVLIPTTDTDLPIISEHRDEFTRLHCTPLIAPPEIIKICRDKTLTFEFLATHGVDTPTTYTPEQIRAVASPTFPLFIKPRTGSASHSVQKLNDRADLDYYLTRVEDPIVQEFVAGHEHTLDVYVGLTGEVRCVVPRRRLQVRSGEVSKGLTVKDQEIMRAGKRVVEAFGPTMRGIVTLQCIVTSEGRIRFIEINPRFGGGAPLAIAAGADFPAWILQELRGESPEIAFDGWQDRLCMFRYDWAVFVPEEEHEDPASARPLHHTPDFE